MLNEGERWLVEDTLNRSAETRCCSDKERYAWRVWDLFNDLDIRVDDIPEKVILALKELMNWEDCAGPCATVDAFLRSILNGWTASNPGLQDGTTRRTNGTT